jgi:hypothetical protein
VRLVGLNAAAAVLAALLTAPASADDVPAAPPPPVLDLPAAIKPSTDKPSTDKASAGKPSPSSALIKQYYAEALHSYVHGDYRQAIIKWTAVVKEAPEQTTAPNMILEARRKILLATKERRARAFDYIGAGQYQKAYLELQALLDQDPGDPQLQELQRRLEKIMKLTAALFPRNKGARAAVLGLKGYYRFRPISPSRTTPCATPRSSRRTSRSTASFSPSSSPSTPCWRRSIR